MWPGVPIQVNVPMERQEVIKIMNSKANIHVFNNWIKILCKKFELN